MQREAFGSDERAGYFALIPPTAVRFLTTAALIAAFEFNDRSNSLLERIKQRLVRHFISSVGDVVIEVQSHFRFSIHDESILFIRAAYFEG